MFITRRKTKQVRVGRVPIGGGAPVVVQSMTTPDTADIKATVAQIHELEQVGCEIVRVTVNTPEAAAALPAIKSQITIPLIADIHFDHRLALKAAEVVDCVRINPGNIGAWWKVEEVVKAVRERNIPLRIGVNGGSLERELLAKYGYPTAEALAESALNAVHALEEIGVGRRANELEKRLAHVRVPLTVSVLRCVDNRIGEGKEADIGIAGGEGHGILFKEGKLVRKVKSEDLMESLLAEIEIMAKEREAVSSDNGDNGHDGQPETPPKKAPAQSASAKKNIPIIKV